MARRRRNAPNPFTIFLVLAVVCSGGYWFLGIEDDPAAKPAEQAAVPLTSDRPESTPLDGGPNGDLPERGESPDSNPAQSAEELGRARALVASGRKALGAGELVTARAQLSEALRYNLPLQETVSLRADLSRLGRQTIFSNTILKDDPFTEAYLVQSGDTLGKIAKKFSITENFIAEINGLANKNIIRVGQRLKVVRGPFHAVVSRANFTMDIYLDQTFVQRFPVGLGAEGSTPSGKWKITNKLENPTYYPPRGGQIVAADDPENPLGERWIGLEGISGDAVGQLRYGVHGTIDPDSIGKNVSLGCVRLHNQDVEQLYTLLVVAKSTVTIR